MKSNVEAIKDAIERRVVIAGLVIEGARELEGIDFKLDADAFGNKKLTSHRREVLEVRKGVLEDAQQELPAESADLQRAVGLLLDPKAAWPDEDDESRVWLCMYQRERIERYCDPEKRKEAMPN